METFTIDCNHYAPKVEFTPIHNTVDEKHYKFSIKHYNKNIHNYYVIFIKEDLLVDCAIKSRDYYYKRQKIYKPNISDKRLQILTDKYMEVFTNIKQIKGINYWYCLFSDDYKFSLESVDKTVKLAMYYNDYEALQRFNKYNTYYTKNNTYKTKITFDEDGNNITVNECYIYKQETSDDISKIYAKRLSTRTHEEDEVIIQNDVYPNIISQLNVITDD
jgi:hypothetical protein